MKYASMIQDHEIYTVSQLNAETRILLEETFRMIWLTGEISNLSQPSSGHLYFSLKDEKAQVRCALFRNTRNRLNFIPANGQQVLIQAQVSLYEPRGDFQLIAVHIEAAGSGALQIAFEKLKNRLAAEGLFDATHKKSLPLVPHRIGVITSSSGAAIRDILTVLKRRFPSVSVLIYPTLVQGNQAATQVAEALKIANRRQECDVLILARGGGSLEDLWPFNEEIVARAIYASQIPVITGIGHEVDFTIADFVADLRAATPSAAAEHAVPDQADLQHRLEQQKIKISKILLHYLQHQQIHLSHLEKRLRHPGQRLQEQMQRIDQMELQLLRCTKQLLQQKKLDFKQLEGRFMALHPKHYLADAHKQLEIFSTQLKQAFHHLFAKNSQQLQFLASALNTVSPLNTLKRGYAILTRETTQEIIRESSQVKVGESIKARIATGELRCVIEKISSEIS